MRWCAIAFVVLSIGCASSTTERSVQQVRASAAKPVVVGVVWWPADSANRANALTSDVEACLTSRIDEVMPEAIVVPQRDIRDALYPLLEPATQPTSETAFGALLARDDVRARLAQRGMRYLVAFTGDTVEQAATGFILCAGGLGAGACLGFMWRGEDTALDAALWSLDDDLHVERERAHAKGALIMPALGLPIPIPARTRVDACRDLGTRIARAIRQAEIAVPAD